DLLLVDFHVGGDVVEQRRPDPVALRMAFHLTVGAVEHDVGTFIGSVGNDAAHALERLAVDQRAIGGIAVAGRAGANVLHGLLDVVDPVAGLAHQHGHRNGHAALPAGAAGRADQARDHVVLVGVGHHDHVVLGAG